MSKTRKLLELVWKYPILYDAKRDGYKDSRRKETIWEEIGRELGETGEVAKKKWKNTKDSYAKYLRSVNAKPNGKDRNSYRNWHWAKQMEIFRPYLSFVKIEVNAPVLKNGIDDLKDENHEQPQVSVIEADTPTTEPNIHLESSRTKTTTTPTTEKRENSRTDFPSTSKEQVSSSLEMMPPSKKRKMSDFHKENHTLARNRVASCLKTNRSVYSGMDGTELIFQGYAETVKIFSPVRQAKIKLQIAELLLEHEIEHQAETAATQFSSPCYRDSVCHDESSRMSFESYTKEPQYYPSSPLVEESQDDKSLVFCNKQD